MYQPKNNMDDFASLPIVSENSGAKPNDTVAAPHHSREPSPASPRGPPESPPAPGDDTTRHTATEIRRRKDPYRHILPRRMSFHTTGVLASFLRPASARRRGAAVSPSADEDPARRSGTPVRPKRGSTQRKVSKSLTTSLGRDRQSLQHGPGQITPMATTLNNDMFFKQDKCFQKQDGHQFEKNARRVYGNVDQYNADGYAALHMAAQSNHLGWMEELLQSNADVNIPSVNVGFTPLHLAARYGCQEAVVLLLKHGASCGASTSLGQRPIHLASRRGHTDIIRVLLEKDQGQVYAVDNDFMTPFHMAAINGDVDVCRLLIDSGVDIAAREVSNMTAIMMACAMGQQSFIKCALESAPTQGLKASELLSDTDNEMKTVLHIAVSNGSNCLVSFLLDSGADVNAQTRSGQTPLHQAAVVGNTDMAELLLDFGATVDKGDNELMTPLHRAAMYNRLSMVELLLNKGADINAREHDDFSPLLCACWRGHIDVVEFLIGRGADLKLRDGELKTCLHWSVEMGHVGIVRALFDEGALDMLEWQDRADQTALHYAAEIANVELVNLLISKGAKGNTRDIDEKTPLHIASQCGRLSCVTILLKNFPNLLNMDDVDGMTPLLLASHSGHHNVVKYLLDTGADIDSRNDEWMSALALAVSKNHLRTTSLLIEHNADISAVDKNKNTPLHLACDAGHHPVTKLLLAAGAELTHRNAAGLHALDVAIERQDRMTTKAIVTSKQWESALSTRDDDGLSPMKKLIEKMPDAALLVLDHCVKKSHSDPNHPDLEITYDFSYIDPGPNEKLTRNSNIMGDKNRFFGLRSMVKYNRKKLLSHEVCQSILSRKWSKFAGILYLIDFFLYLIFLACIVHYTSSSQLITSETQLDSEGCVQVSVNNTDFVFNQEGVLIRVSDPWLWVTQSLITWYCVFLLLMKFIQILQRRLAFFLVVSNYVVILLAVSCLLFTFPPFYPPCTLQWICGAIANFLAVMNFILYIQPIKYFGIYVGMFITTSKSLMKAMTVYAFFILAFGLGFYICFARLDAFRTVGDALLTTFVMTLGEIDQADIFNSGTSLYPFQSVGTILFIFFLFMMPMVLINLTIGIAVGDIEAIFSTAYLQQQQILIDLIWGYEIKLPKYLQRRIHDSKVTLRPNKHSKKAWAKVKQFLFGSALVTEDTGRDDNKTSMVEIVTELHHNRRMISILDVVLQQHTDTLRKISDKFDISNELEDLSSFKETVSNVVYSDT